MFLKLVILILAIQLTHSCIPLGLGANCNCQLNPSCGQCAPPPIPPIAQPCTSCEYLNDVQPSFVNPPQYVAPNLDPSQIPTANNQYPQPLSEPQQFVHQPVAIPIASAPEYNSQPSSDSAINNNYLNERDQQLRNAISEFNEKEHANFPYPGDATTRVYATKRPNASPPAHAPPSDEYSGLPAIYFTMRPNTQVTTTKQSTTVSTEPNVDPYSDDISAPQKANVSIQTTESVTTSGYQSTSTGTTVTGTTTTIKPSSTKAYAFASGTYWAVLEERENENGAVHQRRIPYHSYEQEVCTGATLGRSVEKDLEAVAVKCTQIGCAAVNIRPISDESNEFEAIYLKNVNARRKIKANKVYTCISIVDVPIFEQVYEKREREIQKELEDKNARRFMPKTINQPPRLRFVSIEPKGIYN